MGLGPPACPLARASTLLAAACFLLLSAPPVANARAADDEATSALPAESPSGPPGVPGWIRFEGDLPRPETVFFSLMGLPTEHIPDDGEMSSATARLKRTGLVSRVEAVPEGQGEARSWVVRIERARLIRDLNISGNFPVLETRVREVLPLRKGTAYDPDVIPEIKDALATLFRREGYLGTSILIRETLIKPGWMDIEIGIDKGRPIRIEDLQIIGNPELGGFWTKLYWPLYVQYEVTPVFRFRESELLDAADTLTRAYRKKGYPECEIKIESQVDESEALARVKVVIDKGPRLVLAFVGNDGPSDSELRDQVTFVREGAMDEFEVEASSEAILAHYRNEGYPYARVEATRERTTVPGEEPEVLITFHITEGTRLVVVGLAIDGNRSVPRNRIEKEILTRTHIPILRTGALSEQTVEEDVKTIGVLYGREGFPNANVWVEVGEPGDGMKVGARVIYRVIEGKQVLVRALRFRCDPSVLTPETLLPKLRLKPGSPYSDEAYAEDRKSIVRAVSEAGHPYVALAPAKPEVVETGEATDWVALDYDVSPGPLVRLNDPIVLGNFYTRKRRVLTELTLGPGDPFDVGQIVESKNNLRGLGVFSSVSLHVSGLDARLERVTPIIQVEEAPRYVTGLRASYNAREEFKGAVTLTDRNLFGRAIAADLAAGYGLKGYTDSLSLTSLRLFGSKVRGESYVLYQYDTTSPLYDIHRLKGGGALTRELWPGLTGALGLSAEDAQLSKITVSPDELQIPPKNLTVLFETSLRYDRRDDLVNPHSGWWLGIFPASAGGPLGGDSDFFRYRVEGKYFLTLFDSVILATSLRMGQIVPYGAREAVPLQQRFLLGGLYTVRGFREDFLGPEDAFGRPRGGFVETVGNLEVRFPLYGSVSAQVFSDAGTLTDTWTELQPRSIRYSAGGGLRYETPIGPVRLDYAANLDPRDGEPLGRLYFSFGNPF